MFQWHEMSGRTTCSLKNCMPHASRRTNANKPEMQIQETQYMKVCLMECCYFKNNNCMYKCFRTQEVY